MIVVTGGAGFIGSALIWQLNEAGYEDIVIIDQLGLGDKWKNLLKRKFTNVLSIEEGMDWLIDHSENVEAIFHMGACSSTTERDADYLMSNNLHYSMDLWNICVQKNIPFIYASSAATYGGEEHEFNDDHDSIMQLKPINKYGYSKFLFDRWALSQEKRHQRGSASNFLMSTALKNITRARKQVSSSMPTRKLKKALDLSFSNPIARILKMECKCEISSTSKIL